MSLPHEGKRLNNLLSKIRYGKKVNLTVCLFLCLIPLWSFAQDFSFDARLRQAYASALNLRTGEALLLAYPETSVEEVYIASLAEAIELLITEDYTKFSQYEERLQNRLDQNIKSTSRDYQFLQAELRVQWSFVYLKFGHELDAALLLRQAFQIAQSCKAKYPDYLPIRKTTGILDVILGSIPEKYNWVLGLLNMKGSVAAGLSDLEKISQADHPLSMEGKLLHALVQGFVLQQTESGYAAMQQILNGDLHNSLTIFLTASLALKNSENQAALELLQGLSDSTLSFPFYYADYLKGEAYLQKADYLNSISSFRWFINHHTGQNYIKDAHYKIGLCYWLNGNENDALATFQEARSKGKEATEADKSAARNLAERDPPHINLSKVRYFTDGGYYVEAEKVLSAITIRELTDKKDQVEYYYRKARLAHKLNQSDAATLYQKTIELTSQNQWYFAPNACLQLGYIFQAQNKIAEAKAYFERAISYRRHEYKNSIDSKAKSALAQMKRK